MAAITMDKHKKETVYFRRSDMKKYIFYSARIGEWLLILKAPWHDGSLFEGVRFIPLGFGWRFKIQRVIKVGSYD